MTPRTTVKGRGTKNDLTPRLQGHTRARHCTQRDPNYTGARLRGTTEVARLSRRRGKAPRCAERPPCGGKKHFSETLPNRTRARAHSERKYFDTFFAAPGMALFVSSPRQTFARVHFRERRFRALRVELFERCGGGRGHPVLQELWSQTMQCEPVSP